MNASTPIGKLIDTLKQELKKHRISNREAAKRLGVSEATVKRYLKGKGVSVEALQGLAELVELDLLSLAALAQKEPAKLPGITKAQESALAANKNLRVVFFMTLRGLTCDQIARQYDLRDQMDDILGRLQSLGLIRKSRDGIKILAKPTFGQVSPGEMGAYARSLARQFVDDVDFDSNACRWIVYSLPLSETAASRMQEMMTQFCAELRTLSMRETNLPPGQVKEYRMLLAAQPGGRDERPRA